jgi:NTP pyrophosphatase (non-canonical NTP hydrolase)
MPIIFKTCDDLGITKSYQKCYSCAYYGKALCETANCESGIYIDDETKQGPSKKYNLVEVESDIIEWHKETFPNASYEAKIKKLMEELRELSEAIYCGDTQQTLEEAADVFIVAVSLAMDRKIFEYNVSMCRIIADKMEVNRKRKWGSEDENGDRPRVK